MKALFNSFWRAAAYCLHPRVIALSLLPVALLAVLALGLGYFFWVPALDAVHSAFESWELLATMFKWLESVGLGDWKSVLAPMVIVFLTTPVLVIVSLLVVATMMAPAMLNLVARRRFPTLERRHGGSTAGSVAVSLGSTLIALIAIVLSIPLWFVPPLVLIVPPLIWGWLTYRVMSYDMLAEHADREERRTLMRRHRVRLLGMGVLSGYLGAAPSLVWASGAMFLPLAPVLVPVAIWIYTLVFAFSALWFAHFALAALAALRAEYTPAPLSPPPIELPAGDDPRPLLAVPPI
ncbi:MAG TPA: EI24 domain-containing protein [Rhizobacter sp.]|nr:EI24 domain-containing protein [Rhizobacter sp.]